MWVYQVSIGTIKLHNSATISIGLGPGVFLSQVPEQSYLWRFYTLNKRPRHLYTAKKYAQGPSRSMIWKQLRVDPIRSWFPLAVEATGQRTSYWASTFDIWGLTGYLPDVKVSVHGGARQSAWEILLMYLNQRPPCFSRTPSCWLLPTFLEYEPSLTWHSVPLALTGCVQTSAFPSKRYNGFFPVCFRRTKTH